MKSFRTCFTMVVFVFLISCQSATTSQGEPVPLDPVFLDEETVNPQGVSGGGPLAWPDSRKYLLPAKDYSVSGYSFAQKMSNGTYHLGEDYLCPANTPLYAIGDGKIVYSSFRDGSTNWGGIFVLQISGTNNFYGIYGHVDKKSLPSVGQLFTKGSLVGKVESASVHPNWSTHLHFQLGLGTFSLGKNLASPPGYDLSVDNAKWVSASNYLSNFNYSVEITGYPRGSSYSFGTFNKLPNGVFVSGTLSIHNIGSKQLDGTITTTGANPLDFSVGGTKLSIAPGNSFDLSIYCSPATKGYRECDFNIATVDDVYSIKLTANYTD